MTVSAKGDQFRIHLHSTPPVGGHRPSVDVLFESCAKAAGAKACGVILTGMGKDGAAGLSAMRSAGARTFGQDARSCVVFGMPKAAGELGAVECFFPPHEIAVQIRDRFIRPSRKEIQR
jgi:two-component system chemotaxis response regulator CheB